VQTLFIVFFCQCCPRKRKKEKSVLQPTGVSKSVAHVVCDMFITLELAVMRRNRDDTLTITLLENSCKNISDDSMQFKNQINVLLIILNCHKYYKDR
jgi:hypothetical protein